jgi:hypothetical protein
MSREAPAWRNLAAAGAVSLLAALASCGSPATPSPFPRTKANVALCRDVQDSGAGSASSDYGQGDQGALAGTWRHVSRKLAFAVQDAYMDPRNPDGSAGQHMTVIGGMKELTRVIAPL